MASMPDLQTRPASPLRQKLAHFWRWWSAELVQAMPERLAALRGAGAVPLLSLQGPDLVLLEPRAAASPDARVALDTLDAARGRAAAGALLERAGERRHRVRFCLERHEALVRRITMPAATEENLRQVLAFEMDRLTPFRAEDVYFDYRVVSRDAAAGTLLLMIAVARRELVDARLAMLRGLGLSVQGVTVREETSDNAAALDLLPSEQRGERESGRERSLRVGLAIVVLLLLAMALVWPVYRKREVVKNVMPQVGRAAQEAQATDNLSRELDRLVSDYNFLLGKKHGGPPALAYIEDVSRLLPDNTWVQQFDYKQAGKTREVLVTGETVSSSRLIEIFEQSQLLQNAQTRGTVTRGSQPGTERFMIAAEVRPRPAPEPRPLETAPGGAAAPAKGAPAPAAAPPAPPPAAPPKAAAPAPAPVPAKVEPKAAPKNPPGQ